MPVQVWMPQLGESVTEGTITRWLKDVGEPVEEYEPLVEVNTDKVDTEVPSPASGTLLEIIIPEGTTVQAGTMLAWIGEKGEKPGNGQPVNPPLTEKEPAATHAVQAVQPAPAPVRSARELGFISPVVARIAGEHQVDLTQVPGTGQGGRITKKDVLAYIEQRPAVPSQPAEPTGMPRVGSPAPESTPAGAPALPGKIVPFTTVRRLIAEHMVNSKRTSPHVTTIMEADLSRVVAHRSANKEIFGLDGINLTFTAYFAAAAATSLKAFPLVNSSWSETGIELHRSISIGIATSLGEEGLIVPVIKGADTLSLLGMARAINDLSNRARAHKLQPDEVKGGTFTITNHGTSGSLFATPIINQPQCAILGVGAIQKRVVVLSDAEGLDTIAIRPMVYLGVTFDHRILDGAIADAFLGKIVATLQNWA